MAEHNHPQRLTDKYGRQFSRSEDLARDKENEARKADLEARIAEGVKPHEGMSQFAESFDAALEDAGAVESAGDPVNAAIMQAAEQAGRKVVAASWSQEEKAAKAFVDELEARGTLLGGNGLYVADDDDEPATDAETLRLEAELGQSGDDMEVGVDAAGNQIYRDASTGEDYILVEP